jgi:hypothetical protein
LRMGKSPIFNGFLMFFIKVELFIYILYIAEVIRN